MAEKEPTAEQMINTDDAGVTPWAEAYGLFTGGGTTWLATTRPDGRPHVVPLGAIWMGNKVYFTTGQGTVKGNNLASNAHCVVTIAAPGFDLVVEGEAARVTDDERLQRLAEKYRSQGWPTTAGDGVLDAPYSAPTTGPAPYDVYEITPSVAFAFGSGEETANRTTRYRF